MSRAFLRPIPIVLAALMLDGSLASAQRWEIGARAGISHGAMNGGQEFVWNGAVPTTALFFRRPLSPYFSVQPEVSAVRRLGVSRQPSSTLTLTANYVEVPVMLQLHPATDGVIQPYVTLGPSVAMRWRCTLLFEGGGVISRNNCDASPGSQSHRLDVGVGGGVGVNWRIGYTTLSIDSRYTHGIRTNVLPIDARARAYGWFVTAGVSTFLRRPKGSDSPTRSPTTRVLGSMSDANIAAMLLAFANTDISYARLVPRRSRRSDVRAHAQQMLLDHTQIRRSVAGVMTRLDIGPEDNRDSILMRDESSQQRDPMYFMEAAAFDIAYASGEVRLQREFLASIDDVMLPHARSAEMRALLMEVRPMVAARLATAERLRNAVATPRRCGRTILGTSQTEGL